MLYVTEPNKTYQLQRVSDLGTTPWENVGDPVVGDGGILVPVRDAEAIARAIEKLLGDREERQRLAIAGRERIVRLFSWQVAAAQMIDYYKSDLLEAAGCP